VYTGEGNVIQFDDPWSTDAAAINFDAGGDMGVISGAQLTHGGTTNVNSGAGQFAAPAVFESTSVVNVASGATLNFSLDVADQSGVIVLGGGSITGAQITNNNLIRGDGTITATVVNDGEIRAQGGGTFILEPTSANNDYDGDIDGNDFLLIQRTNPALIPLWESTYGQSAGAAALAVPEPISLLRFRHPQGYLLSPNPTCDSVTPSASCTSPRNLIRVEAGSSRLRDSP
jgi:hypothetical protein